MNELPYEGINGFSSEHFLCVYMYYFSCLWAFTPVSPNFLQCLLYASYSYILTSSLGESLIPL